MIVLLATLACVDPAAFGARPDDGQSDRAAIQKALDEAVTAKRDVCIGPGVWEIDRSSEMASLRVTRGPLTIRGSGVTTVLRLSGDGRQADWRLLQIRGAHDVTIQDLTMDGLLATNTEEQTHLLELAPGAENVVIADVTLGPMRTAAQRIGEGIGGDCIRLLGEQAAPVRNVVVTRTRFVDCDRSSITFQRHLRNIAVIDVVSRGTGDTPIDFEPTGSGSIENVTLERLDLRGSPGWAVTLSGHADEPARNITLTDSYLEGGLWLMNVVDAVISNNTIDDATGRTEGTVAMSRRIERVTFERNFITRKASSANSAPLFRLTHNNGVAPEALTVVRNVLRQDTGGAIVAAYSLGNLTLVENDVRISPVRDDATLALVEAIARDVEAVRIVGNRVSGASAWTISVRSRARHGVSNVIVRSNQARRAALNVLCDGVLANIRGVSLDGRTPAACSPRQPPGIAGGGSRQGTVKPVDRVRTND